MNEHSYDFKSVMLLQNCMGLIKDEPDFGSEACVTALDNGTEEGNIKFEEDDIKVEETLDIKEENSEGLPSPTMEAEPEVSVWACVWGNNGSCFLDHLLPQKENLYNYI
jgi:hypothetical protein